MKQTKMSCRIILGIVLSLALQLLALLSLFLPYTFINGRVSLGWDGTGIFPLYWRGASASDLVQEISLLGSLWLVPLLLLCVLLLRLTKWRHWLSLGFVALLLGVLLNVNGCLFFINSDQFVWSLQRTFSSPAFPTSLSIGPAFFLPPLGLFGSMICAGWLLNVLNPHHMSLDLQAGHRSLREQHVPEALALFDRVLDVDPTQKVAWFYRSYVLLRLKRDEEALTAYDRAFALGLKTASLYSYRGTTLLQLKRYEESLVMYKMAQSLASSDTVSLVGIGRAFYHLQRYEEALCINEQILSQAPEHGPACWNTFLTLCKLERHEEALRMYNWFARFLPGRLEGTAKPLFEVFYAAKK